MSHDRFLRQNPNPVSLDQLKTPDYDVREYRTDEDIRNIRESMESKGQIMPILLGSPENDIYPILDGNHRYLAAKRAGWPDIDAIQTQAGVQDDEAQIISNISRLELSQSEKLATFDYLLSVLDYTQTEAADAVGYDKSQVSRYSSILNGFGEIREYFVSNEIGVQAAAELNKLEDRDRAVDIAQTAVREGYKDADIVTQARNARIDAQGEDVMRGAGSAQQVDNMQQVKANKEAIQSLDPIDEKAVAAAQDGPNASDGTPQAGQPGADGHDPDGEPCMGCGKPMGPGPMAAVQINPELAEQLGVAQIDFGPQCTGQMIQWWQDRQEASTAEPTPAEPDQ